MDDSSTPERVNRELSWLAFNERVLQEAEDHSNPLFERLTFLAIFSSNLEEFFRVRVAWLRSLLRLKKKKLGNLEVNPVRLVREIHRIVSAQQERFGEILRGQILPELERHGIQLIDDKGVSPEQGQYLREYFQQHVAGHVTPVLLDPTGEPPFLRNRIAYLVVELWPDAAIALSAAEPRYALVEIPSPPLDRFVVLPSDDDPNTSVVMFLDDVIRYNLPSHFPGYEVGSAHAIKLTRDAELYIEDEFNEDLVETIRKALKKRETGVPSRFLYDLRASHSLVSFLKNLLRLEDEDMLIGGRYHNLDDLAHFPRFGKDELSFEKWTPQPHPELEGVQSMFDVIREKDRLLHFPYHTYQHVVRFLTDSAHDPAVEEIWLSIYRVSPHSQILSTLATAAERGKRVRVFVEVKARFDEESNLKWAERMEQAGILTIYSMPGLKVHAKIALVVRRENGERRGYGYLGTGNFNEETARFYTDWGLLTADARLTTDVEEVFHFLAGDTDSPQFNHCLVSPFTLRQRLTDLIAAEAEAAKQGRPSGIVAKMNALEDTGIIDSLYDASRSGVPIRLLVRGICCLVPGAHNLSETVEVRSIVDRYLEHGRAARFEAGGEPKIYLGSADWMRRNLDRRVEVLFPIYDTDAHAEIERYLHVQLADNVKARCIDALQTNEYVGGNTELPRRRAQAELHRLVRYDRGENATSVGNGSEESERSHESARSSG